MDRSFNDYKVSLDLLLLFGFLDLKPIASWAHSSGLFIHKSCSVVVFDVGISILIIRSLFTFCESMSDLNCSTSLMVFTDSDPFVYSIRYVPVFSLAFPPTRANTLSYLIWTDIFPIHVPRNLQFCSDISGLSILFAVFV